jgi:exodeoxyribonuclease-1
MSLIFYDTETTGTNTYFDQILQFAAIRTDAKFNEIERFDIRCRLLPDVVPAPGAMRVMRVRVPQLTDPSLPSHYEMVQAVRAKLLSWSPALFIGWNSIHFDEPLMRQALYKTLHSPYLTQTNGNNRTDAMRMFQACSLFAPHALEFPVGENGRPTFKLQRIAAANGFLHHHAHYAVSDAEVTMFLCRQLAERAPAIWSSFARFSAKNAVVEYLKATRVYCLSNFYPGEPYSCVVTTIGQNRRDQAEWYVYDLSIDPESLTSLEDVDLAKRLTEGSKPVRALRSNAAPMIFPAEAAPSRIKSRSYDLGELRSRAERLQRDTALRARLVAAFESQKVEYPVSPHVEKQIYAGFIQRADERLMDAFHEAEWSKRPAIVERFQDSRLRAIGKRLIHLERPDVLDAATNDELDRLTTQRLLGLGDAVEWLTLPKALEEMNALMATATDTELELLREHEQYLRARLAQACESAGSR